jgi:hypothetical protein
VIVAWVVHCESGLGFTGCGFGIYHAHGSSVEEGEVEVHLLWYAPRGHDEVLVVFAMSEERFANGRLIRKKHV